MHISDGVLPFAVTIGGYAASAGLAAWSARSIHSRKLPKVAVVTSAFFVASLVHIPFGPHQRAPAAAGACRGPVGTGCFSGHWPGPAASKPAVSVRRVDRTGSQCLDDGDTGHDLRLVFQTFKGSTLRRQAIVGLWPVPWER